MGTSPDTVEAESAIEIARFARQIKVSSTTVLQLIAAETIMRLATDASVWRTHFDFKWRPQRSDELELSDGTNVFAKARATKERVSGKGDKKIIEDQPGGPDWLVPKAEDFIGPKKQDEQHEREPF